MESIAKLVQNFFLLAVCLGAAAVWAPGFFIRWGERNSGGKIADLENHVNILKNENNRLSDDKLALTKVNDELRLEKEVKNRQNEALTNKNEALERELILSEENLARKTHEATEAKDLIVQKEMELETVKEENRAFQDSLLATEIVVTSCTPPSKTQYSFSARCTSCVSLPSAGTPFGTPPL
jgi:hypothetical protein